MSLFMRIHTWLAARGDRGQATAEYALVVVGAAAVALLLISWATAGGGAVRIGFCHYHSTDDVDRVLQALADLA